MIRKGVIVFSIVGFLIMTANAHAALNAYLRLTGEKQGAIKGSVTQKGRDGAIMVIAFEQMTKIESVATTGIPGKRYVGPIVITKEVDRSSPFLRQMLNTNENIRDAVIEFWQPAPTGVEKQYYTVKLTQARILSIKTVMLNNKNPEYMKYAEYEEVTITYGRADWTWMDGGITTVELP
jgi:type VI secretion system secreted protein Hcp